MPSGAPDGSRTTAPSAARCTTAYPRCSVAAGDSAATRAREWVRSASAASSSEDTDRRPRARIVSIVDTDTSTAWVTHRRPDRRIVASSDSDRSTRPPSTRRPRCRRPSTRDSSSTTSGTTRLPASVGVEHRTSATRSSSGESGSCPIALTTGVRSAATARISASSLNGSRSSTDPPPRAITITSTARSWSSRCSASTIAGTAVGPCTGTASTRNRTAGHRRRAFSSTSRSAALARPVTSPTLPGRNGSGRFRSAANSPSACRIRLSRSSRASSSPTPTGRTSLARRVSVPRPT